MFTVFVEVALRLPLARAYTYHLTSEQAGLVRAGMRVQVSFRNRTEEGLVLAVHSNPPEMLTLPVEKIIDSEPILNGYQLRLAQWMADYYLAGVGECLFKMFPRGRRYPAPQGRKKRKARNPAHDLNAEQSLVFERIQQDLMERSMRYAPESVTVAVDQMEKDNRATPSDRPPLHLIHGVTGSGKTEIYIHSILAALELNRGAILLVPEIALTVQLIERLRSVFGEELALLHSALTGSMRFAAYMQLLRGEKQIAVGTRSAVFAPVQNPGIIIIDEEHDGSYREHSAPRYDARQVAYQRAREQGAVLLAGSATPRLEATYNARVRGPETGSVYHVLHQRATGASLPAVHIVPMSAHDVPISGVLLKELEANYRAGQQSMLLLNRRGYHPGVYCRQCEQVQTCPSCSVALNLHRDGTLVCHYCGYKRKDTGRCVTCQSPLKRIGSGTQKLEEYLLNLYPEMRLERLDTDSAARRNQIQESIGRLLNGELDVLVGTQMIAKGLDAPRVTLVGVLQADHGLYLPDYRAGERTFALLTQVAGRAGRGAWRGRVYFECLNPEHPLLIHAARQDYESFYQEEIQNRHAAMYPPFCRMVRLLYRSENAAEAEAAINYLSELLRNHPDMQSGPDTSGHVLLGPAPAPLEKINNQFRFHLLIKTLRPTDIRTLLATVLADNSNLRSPGNAHLELEFDPVDLL